MADWKEVIDEHILSNTGDAIRNPMPAFNFVLEVEGVFFLPLRSVKPFTKENEYEYIKEGGYYLIRYEKGFIRAWGAIKR